MKKMYVLILMATLASWPAFADDEHFGTTNVSTSECKWHNYTSTRATDDDDEWIEYSVEKRADGLYLHIKHINIFFNCATLGAECSATLDNNVLTLEIHEKAGSEMADCICPYDVTYDIGPLQEGVYTMVLTMHGHELATFSVYISESYQNRFNVSAYVTKIETTLPVMSEDEVVYDLRGRRYSTFPFPGIFVKGGKKIVWKGQ